MTVDKRVPPAAILVLFVGSCFLSPQALSAGQVSGSVEFGFDSFTEKYSIIERDTLDRLTEFRSRFNLGYLRGSMLNEYLRLEGQGLIGESSYDGIGKVKFMKRLGSRTRFLLDSEIMKRSFRDDSEYEFANDFLKYNLRAYLRRSIKPSVSVQLTEKVEWMDFEEQTEFDYDYARNHVVLSGDYEPDLSTLFHGAFGLANKSIPDTTEISYKAYTMALEMRRSFGFYRQFFMAVDGERRLYTYEPARSSFWALQSNINCQPFRFGPLVLSIDNVFESYFYDRDSDVYFDYVENRAAMLLDYHQSFDLSFGIGPTIGRFISKASPEDEYSEYGGKVSVDFNHGASLWLSGSYELGRRDYDEDKDSTTDVMFSDFMYQRVLLFATVRAWKNVSVNLFLTHEPEDHRIEDDDATTTLFSLDLGYSF
jgi:hypothetical protein